MSAPAAKPAPIALDQVPAEWIELRREIIQRDGYALRAGDGNSIEVKSLTPREQMAERDPLRTNAWCPLALPGGAVNFRTAEDRDAVLSQLLRR